MIFDLSGAGVLAEAVGAFWTCGLRSWCHAFPVPFWVAAAPRCLGFYSPDPPLTRMKFPGF